MGIRRAELAYTGGSNLIGVLGVIELLSVSGFATGFLGAWGSNHRTLGLNLRALGSIDVLG